MEGDVRGLMPRPNPLSSGSRSSPDYSQGETEKWDAWAAQEGLSRAEAKRRYIEMLISTMKSYASGTREGRELVGELEFVWEQVKGNNNGSMSGSASGVGGAGYGSGRGSGNKSAEGEAAAGLRVLRPLSEDDEVSERREEYMTGEEEEEGEDEELSEDEGRRHGGGGEGGSAIGGDGRRAYEVRTRKWRRRMEGALIRMTAEVAALREVVEGTGGRRQGRFELGRGQGHGGFMGFGRIMLWFIRAAVRHVLVDLALVVGVVLWCRRKGERRVEKGLRLAMRGLKEQMRTSLNRGV